jgi:hypothetical protein
MSDTQEESMTKVPIEGAASLLEKVGAWFVKKWGRYIRIKEIKKLKDEDIFEAFELYERLFKEEHRIVPSDLVAWLRQKGSQEEAKVSLQHCLLVAKRHGAVVGILKAIFCPDARFVFISYFGIDRADAITRKAASKMMLYLFKSYLLKKWRECEGIAFEMDMPQVGLTKDENDKRKARLRLFRDMARHQGYNAFKLKIDYRVPKVGEDTSYSGLGGKMGLMFIPIKERDPGTLPRTYIDRLLNFIIFRIYATTQVMPNRKRNAYVAYLGTIHATIFGSLADDVELED